MIVQYIKYVLLHITSNEINSNFVVAYLKSHSRGRFCWKSNASPKKGFLTCLYEIYVVNMTLKSEISKQMTSI